MTSTLETSFACEVWYSTLNSWDELAKGHLLTHRSSPTDKSECHTAGAGCHVPLLMDCSPFPLLLLQFPSKSFSAELMPAKPFLSWLLFLLGLSPPPWSGPYLPCLLSSFALHPALICHLYWSFFLLFLAFPPQTAAFIPYSWISFPLVFHPSLFSSRYISFRQSSSVECLKYIFTLVLLLFLTCWMCLL